MLGKGQISSCSTCKYFDNVTCHLRYEKMEFPEATTCNSCNKEHKVPYGIIYAIHDSNVVPYLFGKRPNLSEHISIQDEKQKLIKFSTVEEYLKYHESSINKDYILIGALAGDIIGSIYEWDNHKSTEFELFSDSSFYTDDSVLTLAVANKFLSDKTYIELLQRMGKRYPNCGYGESFINWIHKDNAQPYNSYGNGSAMRVSSVAYACKTLEKVLKEAKESAEITHNHPEGIKGAQATAAAIFLARTGSSKSEIKDYIKSNFEYDLDRTTDEIRPDYEYDVSCQGTVPEAIVAFLESKNFEQSIRLAVSLGGDSDTLACITGSIAEAFYKKIPEKIKQNVIQRLPEELMIILRDFSLKYNPN